MPTLKNKINKTRQAMQMLMEKAERVQEEQKRLMEEIKDDHVRLEDPFYQESICDEAM